MQAGEGAAATPIYARSDQVEASSVGDRMVLYHRTSRTALVLNVTGSRLWERLARPADVHELSEALRERFPELPPSDARRDVLTFIEELTRHGAIAPSA